MLKLYVTAKFNRGVKNRRLPDFVETIRISQLKSCPPTVATRHYCSDVISTIAVLISHGRHHSLFY